MRLLALALAPVVALFTYFYVRDKYEKEPRLLLFKVFTFGMLSVVPAVILGVTLQWAFSFFIAAEGFIYGLLENFIVIALVEEAVKFCAFFLPVFWHPAFNEPYDGMLYAITSSLGFAAVENVLYVAQGGTPVALARMVLAVPAHALFGAFMGYYVGRAKFSVLAKSRYLCAAIVMPVLLHGTYNWLLGTERAEFVYLVIPLSLFMWHSALRQVRRAEERSPFRPQTDN